MSNLTFEQFKELNKREVNKSIVRKLGFECDDSWQFNQNAMRDGIESKYYANLTIAYPGSDKFHVIGWNPYNSYSDAFCLMCDMNLGMPAVFKDKEEARLLIVYYAYLESLK